MTGESFGTVPENDSTTASAGNRHRTALCAVVAMSLTIGAVSCGGGGSSRSTTDRGRHRPEMATTPSRSASPATSPGSSPFPERAAEQTEASLESEIVSRYLGFWGARVAANRDVPNPDDPGLRDFATGDQLERVVAETRTNLERGLAFRPAASPTGIQRVTVVEVAGDHAVVQECVVADGVIVRRDTGEIVDDTVATHNVRGELVRMNGAWKVSSTQLVQRWKGVAGCARAS